MPLHPILAEVTARIAARSAESRRLYGERWRRITSERTRRTHLSCSNLAHGFAACAAADKAKLAGDLALNLGIVSAYNDMLSAHQPFAVFPDEIKRKAAAMGATAQVAGGVPAMCDGVTQGQIGMEMSLWSRDVIALATAVALSHDMFDAAILLGVCDKIVPGLIIGALGFGHLPVVLAPAGPMPSGLPNAEKARIRQRYAAGEASRAELLKAEADSYHAPGTCTFYGTANSNQMLMEVMGLHLPGAAFVNPGTDLRRALTAAAAERALGIAALGSDYRPIGRLLDERAFVNAIVGLLATGGSTNHTIHLIAMAEAAGIRLDWQDFADLSRVTPLLCRLYPNGEADVNHFHAAGGMGFLIRELIGSGHLHRDHRGIVGDDLSAYAMEPYLDRGELAWRAAPDRSLDEGVLRPVTRPFAEEGGIRILTGNLGRAVIKVSAVKPEHRHIRAPVALFRSQADVIAAFKAGRLHRDVVVVLIGQGPRANGMPELHQLTPTLSVLLDLGYRVALVTDGRMSGASGKVPAAIHVTPEAAAGGWLAHLRDGDVIDLDVDRDRLAVEVAPDELAKRVAIPLDLADNRVGLGRELFGLFRAEAGAADRGASALFGKEG